jgi:hypothetical protein
MLLTNRPTGSKFFHNQSEAGKILIKAEFDNCEPISIVREIGFTRKGESKVKESKYHFGEHHYKGFGTSVPEPILKAINLDPDINIQREDDSPFLISSSSGEITRTIGRATGLDKSEILLKVANRKVDSARKEMRDAALRLETSKKKLRLLDGIEEIGELINRLDRIEKRIKQSNDSVDSIHRHLKLINQAGEIDIGHGEKLFKAIAKLEGTVARRSEAVQGFIASQVLVKRLDELKLMENAAKKAYERAKKEAGICPVCEKPF